MGLYQLKKPKGPSIAYFTTCGIYGNLVETDPILKKGYKHGWLVADGKLWKDTRDDDVSVQIRNSFNKDNVIWTKGSCPVQEVGEEVHNVVERIQASQESKDVLDKRRL